MINEIIKYVSLGIGLALLIITTIIAWKLHVFSRLIDEARDKDQDNNENDEGKEK